MIAVVVTGRLPRAETAVTGAGAAISAFITSLGIGNRERIPLGYLLEILRLDNAITSVGRIKIPTQMIGALIELSPRAGASRRPLWNHTLGAPPSPSRDASVTARNRRRTIENLLQPGANDRETYRPDSGTVSARGRAHLRSDRAVTRSDH